MNREILFRGKRKQDGLWCHGDLVRLKDGDTQMPYIYYFGEVYPASIGQFTGVYDKNGDEIYEGDILELDGAEIPEEERAEVVFTDGRFRLKNLHYDYIDDLDSLTASMEIIVGNTYDGIYGEDKGGDQKNDNQKRLPLQELPEERLWRISRRVRSVSSVQAGAGNEQKRRRKDEIRRKSRTLQD